MSAGSTSSANSTSYISGVISGLDTSSILSQLRTVESASVTQLQSQQTQLNTTLSTWQSFNSKLLALKSALDTLSSVSTFQATSVSVTNPEALNAASTGYPAIGNTSFSILALAQTNQLSSQGYADTDTTLVGDGSLTVNGEVVQTDGLTLAGVRDAINGAGAGVTASLIDTGTGSTPYRLLLTSKTSGAAGAISLSSTVTGTEAPAFTTVTQAQDAHLQFGSGATALDVYRPTNQISDVISGLNLNLTDTTTSPVTVSVNTDLSGVQDDVQTFVSAYNDVESFINTQSQYDPSQATPPLFGDLQLMSIADQIDQLVTGQAAGVDPSLSLLSQAGITRNDDGTLSVNQTTLNKVLNQNPTGVLKLFCSYATCPQGVTFVDGTSSTKPSSTAGYSLDITQAATQAHVTAGLAMTGPLGADETLTLNGVAVTLTAGMTQDQVAAALNAVSSRSGCHATFTGSAGVGAGNYLTLTELAYGSRASISAVSSLSNSGANTTGLGELLVTEQSSGGESGSGTGAAGLDVAGSIDGAAATGSGQFLTATTGDAAGLKLLVQTGAGTQGSVVYSQGLATALDTNLSFITQNQAGAYQSAITNVQSQLDEVAKQITEGQNQVNETMDRYTEEFNNMEAALAKLQTQSTYLSNQLAQMNKSSSS